MAKTRRTKKTAQPKPAEASAEKPAEITEETVLRVKAKTDRFRRAGRTFSRTETRIRLEELTAEQVAALKAEPMLVVIEDD